MYAFIYYLSPDITGWMLFSIIVIPRRYAKLATAFCISLLLVKMMANWFLVARITAADMIPMQADSITVTMTEYFAALGCPEPSSFDTLTLKRTNNTNIITCYIPYSIILKLVNYSKS